MERLRVVDSLAGVRPQRMECARGRAAVRPPRVPLRADRHRLRQRRAPAGGRSSSCCERGGALAGAMPLFAKSHSYGEYVFDWAWADAHERHGVRVLPEAAVRRALHAGHAASGCSRRRSRARAAAAGRRSSWRRTFSSLHVLFAPDDGSARCCRTQRHAAAAHRAVPLEERGLRRLRGFPRAPDRTRGARTSARSAAGVREAGVTFRWLRRRRDRAPALGVLQPLLPRAPTPRTGSSPYLNLEFFLRLGATLPQQHGCMVLAERAGRPIAASLFLIGRDDALRPLLGRARSTCRCCTSSAATTRRSSTPSRSSLQAFEGGAQGEHKIVPRPAAGRDAFGALARAPALRARGRAVPGARGRGHRALRRTSCATIARSRTSGTK